MSSNTVVDPSITPSSLVALLKRTEGSRSHGLDRLKIIYRPLICPFHELLALIPCGSSVFDLGCGSGTFLRLVAELRSPLTLGGIEISQRLIDTAAELLQEWNGVKRLEVYDGERIPGWIAEYDYVTLIDVLHHVPADRQESFLRSIHEKMKPGSKLIIKDIDAGRRVLVLFNKLHDFIISRDVGHELSARKVEQLTTSFGFKCSALSRKRMWFYPHFTLVCEKIVKPDL